MFHFLGCSGLIELFGILEVIVLLVKPVVGIVPLEELVWHVLLVCLFTGSGCESVYLLCYCSFFFDFVIELEVVWLFVHVTCGTGSEGWLEVIPSHARTRMCAHARTHTRTHTHISCYSTTRCPCNLHHQNLHET